MKKNIPDDLETYPFGTEQIPLSSEYFQPQRTVIVQSSGTTQTRVERHLSNRDLIKRVSTLENNLEQLNSLFIISSVYIHTLGSKKWKLIQPLNVTIEQRGSEDFVACLYDVDLYGYGDVLPEALDDLKLAIVNQFEYLLEQKQKMELSSSLLNQVSFFQEILEEIDA